MDLLVLRHGKSSWADLNLVDELRPLKKRGRRDARNMGAFIRDRQLLPDLILSSTATRTEQTVKRALKSMGLPKEKIQRDGQLYHAGPRTWLQTLRACPADAHRVMIVGHNPGLEELIVLLCSHQITRPADGKLLPTAALAHLQISGTWAALEPGVGTLLSITRPRTLTTLSPIS